MFYIIRHVTHFRYSGYIRESLMEVRMQPRSDALQRCHRFHLSTIPAARVLAYRDYLGNVVHHFDVPGRHNQLVLTTEALVDIDPPTHPSVYDDPTTWDAVDDLAASNDAFDFVLPSRFAKPGQELADFIRDTGIQRETTPLQTALLVNTRIYRAFEYAPDATHVHSPIADALRERKGVCQDFAHVMIAVLRGLGIPCRYVSGYLFHRLEDHDRVSEDASHAWVEALLPELGWVGLDPTHDSICTDRHIRTAVGRDYADVPPTRGVYKGDASETLSVAVSVLPGEPPQSPVDDLGQLTNWLPPEPDETEPELTEQQYQQQQQQQ